MQAENRIVYDQQMRFEELSTLSRVCDSIDAPMGDGIREAERAE
jgi:hypothetical protein